MRAGSYGFAAVLLLLTATPVAVNAQTAASPAPAPSASAAAPSAQSADDAILARAKAWLHYLQTGTVDDAARAQLSDTMKTALTPAALKGAAAQFGPLGAPQSFTFLGKQPVQGDTAYVYRVVFKTATLNEVFVLNKDGKVDGVQLPPAQ